MIRKNGQYMLSVNWCSFVIIAGCCALRGRELLDLFPLLFVQLALACVLHLTRSRKSGLWQATMYDGVSYCTVVFLDASNSGDMHPVTVFDRQF